MPVIDDAAAAEPSSPAADEAERAGPLGHHAPGAAAAEAFHAVSALVPESRGGETPAQSLARLKIEAEKMKGERKALMRNLRNARRCNARLKSKARKLSNADLLAIVAMRQTQASNPKVRAEPPGMRGGAGSASSAGLPPGSSTDAPACPPQKARRRPARDEEEGQRNGRLQRIFETEDQEEAASVPPLAVGDLP
jgi:hypothetical protein